MYFTNSLEDISAPTDSIIWNEEKTKAIIYSKTFAYYVDIEKGVVAAKMINPEEEARRIVFKAFNCLSDEKNIFSLYRIDESYLGKYFSTPICAKAVCAEVDEFDLETGKKIARERCLAKYYKRLTNVFVKINNCIDPFLCDIEDLIIKYSERYKKYSGKQS